MLAYRPIQKGPGLFYGIFALVMLLASSAKADTLSEAPFPGATIDAYGLRWPGALTYSAFTNFSSRLPAAEQTSVSILKHAGHLYIGFVCQQSQATLRLSSNVADIQAASVDYVEVQFDPTGNGTRIYSFLASPTGLRWQRSTENARYEPAWSSSARIFSDGYVVILDVPLSVIRAQTNGADWKVNFLRHLGATNDDYTAAYSAAITDLQTDSRNWLSVGGIAGVAGSTRQRASADVYGLESVGADRTSFSYGHQAPRILGIDARIPLSNTLSAVAALNPDFTNVERDQYTISPQEFKLLLREYRPFFAQGASYVAPLLFAGVAPTPVYQFYTPAIGIFDRGLKVEGTVGLSQVGLLETKGASFDDMAYGYQFTDKSQSTHIALQGVRANHQGATDSSLGMSVFKQNPKSGFYVSASGMIDRGTFVTQPGLADAYVVDAGIHTSSWNVVGGYEGIGPQFYPLDGYLANNDIRGPYAQVAYTGTAHGVIKSYVVQTSGDRFLNAAGTPVESDTFFSVQATTKSLLSLNASKSIGTLTTFGAVNPTYSDPAPMYYAQTTLGVGIGDGTPTFIDANYSWGPFGVYCYDAGIPSFCNVASTGLNLQANVRQISTNSVVQLSQLYSLGLEYDGSVETALASTDSQWLRRVSLSRAIGKTGSVSIAYRVVNGNGGYAVPGHNISLLFSDHLPNLDHVYFEFGSPSGIRTLNRFIFKYVWHLGGKS